MVKSDIENNLMPMVVLLAITLINTGIVIGFLLNSNVDITGTQIFTLVILEILAGAVALRQGRRRNKDVLV